MKSNTLFLLLLLGCILLTPYMLSAQSIKKSASKKKSSKITSQKATQETFTREDDNCVFTNKYTPEQRRKMYPFAKSASILAVAYRARNPDRLLEDGTIKQHTEAGLWIKDGVLDTTTLLERKKLTLVQTDELSKLLFNTDYKRPGYNIEDLGKCYEPRNSFVFFDKDNKVLDVLEICFGCKGSHTMSEKFDIGINCNQKYELLSDYFKSIGITYGPLGRDYRKNP